MPAIDFTLVATGSDSELDGRRGEWTESDDDSWSKTTVGKILGGLAVACALVMGTSCLASVYRGRAAADAALQGYMAMSVSELNPDKMEDAYDSEMAERLLDRAGRAEDLKEAPGESMMSIGEILEKARNGEFASFKGKLQDAKAAANTTSNATTTTPQAPQGPTSPVWTEEPTPYPTQSPEEIEHVINELICTKLNEFLSTQQTNLNAAMPALIGPQVRKAKFPSTNKQKVDRIEGLESLYIDTMECEYVKSDLSTGTANAHIRIYATTDPLTIFARARPGNSGSYYHIRMHVYGFYISSNPVGVIDFAKQSLTAVKVGWIATGCDRLDGTCYSKSNPNSKDSLCTAILNKRLRKERAGMFRQMSSTLSRQAQGFANKITPFKLPQPPPPPPTAPPTNSTQTNGPIEL
jgi:hypothetical protein